MLAPQQRDFQSHNGGFKTNGPTIPRAYHPARRPGRIAPAAHVTRSCCPACPAGAAIAGVHSRHAPPRPQPQPPVIQVTRSTIHHARSRVARFAAAAYSGPPGNQPYPDQGSPGRPTVSRSRVPARSRARLSGSSPLRGAPAVSPGTPLRVPSGARSIPDTARHGRNCPRCRRQSRLPSHRPWRDRHLGMGLVATVASVGLGSASPAKAKPDRRRKKLWEPIAPLRARPMLLKSSRGCRAHPIRRIEK